MGRVLQALQDNNLHLSASKTIICPQKATILGWICKQASPHKIAVLSSISQPPTMHGLRSLVGSYKDLSRVLLGYAELPHPLDEGCEGQASSTKISWSDELLRAFKQAQDALQNNKVIVMPQSYCYVYGLLLTVLSRTVALQPRYIHCVIRSFTWLDFSMPNSVVTRWCCCLSKLKLYPSELP